MYIDVGDGWKCGGCGKVIKKAKTLETHHTTKSHHSGIEYRKMTGNTVIWKSVLNPTLSPKVRSGNGLLTIMGGE